MNIRQLMRATAVAITKKRNTLFSISAKKQEEYLNGFNIPNSRLERSFFQYRCQMKEMGFVLSLFINVLSFPILLLYLYLTKRNKKVESEASVRTVAFIEGDKFAELLSSEELKSLEPISHVSHCPELFSSSDKAYVLSIWREHPCSFHFVLKILMKIRNYSFLIQVYHPETIIVCSEYSFASSALSDYCNQHNVKHYNVMHGEKLFFIRDSFFSFDRCYVWDEYYIKLFKDLKADEGQFVIDQPSMFRFLNTDSVKEFDYTYYLGNEQGRKLDNIMKVLEKLHLNGRRVALRPHPLYTNLKEVYKKKQQYHFEIQLCSEIGIKESLQKTNAAISRYSTVLNQAQNNGICVVIDDVTNRKDYEKLAELRYIMLYKPHKLLSEILEC